ncbi:hypothetical protein AHiyo4_25870 [Arthrobacter sp. Hiyo4]|nr:hypothetical protein AHiyo4_25870 [Arthrobacter sp. Hiyo4]
MIIRVVVIGLVIIMVACIVVFFVRMVVPGVVERFVRVVVPGVVRFIKVLVFGVVFRNLGFAGWWSAAGPASWMEGGVSGAVGTTGCGSGSGSGA